MQIIFNVNKCSECPYYKERYEFGEYTAYCGHKDANDDINSNGAYLHVGANRIPKDSISWQCPIKRGRQ